MAVDLKKTEMQTKEEKRERLRELRKIEKQAKRLIYKMHHLENEWKKLRSELAESGSSQLPKSLGDVIANWNRLEDLSP